MNADLVIDKKTTVTLDGQEYVLKFTLNSIIALEDEFGSLDAAMKAMSKNSVKHIRFFLWAGLQHIEPALSLARVGAMIDFRDLENIVKAMHEAMTNALPKQSNPNK